MRFEFSEFWEASGRRVPSTESQVAPEDHRGDQPLSHQLLHLAFEILNTIRPTPQL